MAIVTAEDVRRQLAFTIDTLEFDDAVLIESKIEAAQNYIERWLGYPIATRFGGEGQDPVPPSLKEAVCQLTAWWFENRETAGEGAREMPFGVSDIVDCYRDRSF
jgi:hypothetical protein